MPSPKEGDSQGTRTVPCPEVTSPRGNSMETRVGASSAQDIRTIEAGRGASRWLASSLSLLLVMTAAAFPARAQVSAPGGFVERATSTETRPRVVPPLPARGPFTFPAPYNTTGVRLTNASDCSGADCVRYVGYSYWRNINNHVGSNSMLIFLSLDRRLGGGGPTLYRYDKT